MSSSPSPKPKWSSRMGGAIRRSSTLLAISRPSTPSGKGSGSDRDSDAGSLRRSTSRSSLTSPPIVPAHVSSPSPIAESPVREAAALQPEAAGPSPLTQQTETAEADPTAAVTSPESAPAAAEEATSPVGYIPPPVIDSTVGNPGAFTDDPDALPQTETVFDPYAATNTTGRSAAPSVREAEPKAAETEAAPAPQVEAPTLEPSDSYFDKPIAESMKSDDSLVLQAPGFAEAVEEHAAIPPLQDAHEEEVDHTKGEAAEYYKGDPPMPVAEPHRAEEHVDEEQHEQAQEVQAEKAQPVHQPTPRFGAAVMPSYDLPSYNQQEVWGDSSHVLDQKPHDVWAGAGAGPMSNNAPGTSDRKYDGSMPVPIPIPIPIGSSASGNGHASYHSQSSMRMPNPHPETHDVPFTDRAVLVVGTHPELHHPDVSQPHIQVPVETHEDSHGTIFMPLPPFQDVSGPRAIDRAPSNQSVAGKPTTERTPLLARPVTPNKYLQAHGQQATSQSYSYNSQPSVSPQAGTSSANGFGSTQPRLIELGWVEYLLPDGTIYYYHMTNKITTDLNLRSERVLAAVNLWMEGKENESIGVDVEGWLCEAKASKKASKGGWGRKPKEESMVLERYWVDHHHRSVTKEDVDQRKFIGYGRNHAYSNGHGHSHSGKGKTAASVAPKVEEDKLDLEYRYWSYMEAHPAHLPVSQMAKADALDVLNWAWTDRLLPSHRSVPAPFTQQECRELRPLLQSFDRESEHGDRGIQTRIIARVLLRVAQWRQIYFRPNKSLPTDVDASGAPMPIQPRPFRRAVFDFLISCLCLGIPYLFFERARLAGSRPSDEESGLLRGPSPMLIIGACTCIVAAIVLSASVTFLSLPGLDNVARTAGMVAVLFAAFSMAATGVAVLRHKTDLERPIPHVGVEGLMVVSRRTIALSLPVVFLAYSIIGFVTAMTLYSFRGVSLDDSKQSRSSFDDYTRWTVVGVLGALAGMVTTSMFVLRR